MTNTMPNTVSKILTKLEMSKVMKNCGGVGTPFIIHDPYTFERFMIFTAWPDDTGIYREIWVAPIDDNLKVNLNEAKQIVDPAIFEMPGLDTSNIAWDSANDQWIITASGRTGKGTKNLPKKSYSYFIFLDRNWNVMGKQIIDFENNLDGVIDTPELGDGGVGIMATGSSLILSTGYGSTRSLYTINDTTVRPLPKPILANRSGAKKFNLVSTYNSDNMAVHQLFVYNGQLMMLSELIQHSFWHTVAQFGPDKDWTTVVPPGEDWEKVPAFNMLGKYHMPCTLKWPYGYINYSAYWPEQLLHPHYTTEFSFPALFFITRGPWAYSHEIWATEIEPQIAFDATKNFPLIASSTNEPFTIGKIPIPTFGSDTITISLFGVNNSGNLYYMESDSPYNIWAETDMRYIEKHSINSGANKIVINKPGPYIALKTDVDLSQWMVVIR